MAQYFGQNAWDFEADEKACRIRDRLNNEYDALIDRLIAGKTAEEIDAYEPSDEDVDLMAHLTRRNALCVEDEDFQAERLKEEILDPDGERARMFDEEAAWMERHRK